MSEKTLKTLNMIILSNLKVTILDRTIPMYYQQDPSLTNSKCFVETTTRLISDASSKWDMKNIINFSFWKTPSV